MFDDNKVIWSTHELLAGAAADRVYESIAKYIKNLGHPFGLGDVPGLAAALVTSAGDVYTTIKFVFESMNMRDVLDRTKDLVVMLERDNDWIDQPTPPGP